MVGKSPLYEVRKMDSEYVETLKPILISKEKQPEESKVAIMEEKSAEVDSDQEDVDNSLKRFKKLSSKRSMSQKSSPVLVYTYKVRS